MSIYFRADYDDGFSNFTADYAEIGRVIRFVVDSRLDSYIRGGTLQLRYDCDTTCSFCISAENLDLIVQDEVNIALSGSKFRAGREICAAQSDKLVFILSFRCFSLPEALFPTITADRRFALIDHARYCYTLHCIRAHRKDEIDGAIEDALSYLRDLAPAFQAMRKEGGEPSVYLTFTALDGTPLILPLSFLRVLADLGMTLEVD